MSSPRQLLRRGPLSSTTSTWQHVMVDQMHVRRYGDTDGARLPVVLVHGGAQTGSHWEHTPDGRPGFAHLLASQGRAVYVVDLPGAGRSRYHDDQHGHLTHFSAELTERAFTATAVPTAAGPAPTSTPNGPALGGRGDPVFDTFYASQVGYLAAGEVLEPAARAAGAALADMIGTVPPPHPLTGRTLGWHIADERPDLVRSIVALEPKGPPNLRPGGGHHRNPPAPLRDHLHPAQLRPSPRSRRRRSALHQRPPPPTSGCNKQEPPYRLARLAGLPVLVVTAEASYHTTYDHRTVHFLREAGVTGRPRHSSRTTASTATATSWLSNSTTAESPPSPPNGSRAETGRDDVKQDGTPPTASSLRRNGGSAMDAAWAE